MSRFRLIPWQSEERDLARVMTFISETNRHPDFTGGFHLGDFFWQYWRGSDRSKEASISIVEDETGAIAAMGWFDPPDEMEATIHPALLGSPNYGDLASVLIELGERTTASLAEVGAGRLGITVVDSDHVFESVLRDRGYVRHATPWLAANRQSLEHEIPAPELPEGFTFVAMTDQADHAERVDLHREVWNPSKLALEGYLLVRTSPTYDPGLDLVVREPGGRYVAYVHGWYDASTQIGLLEPVGCREAWRGRRLTSALIREVLRRFQERGATTAMVCSDVDEVPANALYRSTGFERFALMYQWHQPEVPGLIVTLDVSHQFR